MSGFATLVYGSLDDLLELLNGEGVLTLEEQRAVLANLAGKLQQLEKRVAKLEPQQPSTVCAMQGCDDPVKHGDGASGAFCAVHERELRLEQEITDG